MVVSQRPMTAEDLRALPNDGKRHELVEGELRTMAPTGAEHSGLEGIIAYHFWRTLATQPLGQVAVGEGGFRLSRDPDTVRAADVAFIRAERVPPTGLPTGYFEGAPDLAVEIVSPGDTAAEVDEKVREWLRAGTRAVWVLYPAGPSLVIHRADGTALRLAPVDEVDGGEAFPGFRMRLAELIRAPGMA